MCSDRSTKRSGSRPSVISAHPDGQTAVTEMVFPTGGGGEVTLEVETVSVSAARRDMAGLLRKSLETGRAFLIRNAKTRGGRASILIDEKVFRQKMAQARPIRTLGQIVDGLPFRQLGQNPVLVTMPLPHDVLPPLDLRE